jgi:hypothetical protein
MGSAWKGDVEVYTLQSCWHSCLTRCKTSVLVPHSKEYMIQCDFLELRLSGSPPRTVALTITPCVTGKIAQLADSQASNPTDLIGPAYLTNNAS